MYALLLHTKKKPRSFYDNRESKEAKAERIIRKFSRRVEVRHERSVMFLYSRKPILREVCMKCDRTGSCPLSIPACPVDQAIDEALIGFRALLYARVKAKIVFPAP